jgi:hypothetical protein
VRFKDAWAEASGALGDLGTFVPIAIALTLVNGLDLGTTLLFTGAYNIATGLLFGVPMPVQPMKSIAAVAISQSDPLSLAEIAAAGISTAGLMIFLGVTGLMGFVQRVLPMPLVRGIQLSQGISFGKTAVAYVLKEQDFSTSSSSGARPWLGLDGKLLAVAALLFVIVATGSGDRFAASSSCCPPSSAPDEDQGQDRNPDQDRDRDRNQDRERNEEEEERSSASTKTTTTTTKNKQSSASSSSWSSHLEVLPTALIVFLVGVVLAFVRDPSIWGSLALGPSASQLLSISWSDWKTGFVRGAIPQIPLSILNSVIAVCKLSNDLFPEKLAVTPTAVSTSVGIMNLVGCWFGAMPVCHGAGGLAGQTRFGARSGAAVVLLGTAKIALGLLVGSSLVEVLSAFPIGLLGVLLLFAGVELAMACRDQTSRADAFVMIVCTVVSLGSDAALGFGSGLVLHILLKLRETPPALWWPSFRDALLAPAATPPAGYFEIPSSSSASPV